MAPAPSAPHLAAMDTIMTANPALDEDLWQRVLNRAPSDFLYGVATMGVYCRTTCPSRPPMRKNARY